MHVCRTLLRPFSRSFHGLAGVSALAFFLFSSFPAGAQDCLPTPPGLVSWWRAEGNANDFAGTNNGVLVNGVGFAAGEVGQSFTFNGANQYVQIADNPSLHPTGSFTIEAWIYPLPSAGAQIILSKWGDTGDYSDERCYVFAIVPGNAMIFAISDLANQWNGAFQGLQTGNNVISFNVWSHVVAVYDQISGTRQIYLNGVVVAQRTDPPITILNAGNPVGIGAGPYASDSIRDFFTGKIDEVSFYNVALNPVQVRGLYLAGAAGKCTQPAPPQIISQPQDQSVIPGQSASFSVAVTGSGPVAYQWLFDGNTVAGATGSSYTLTNPVPANNGVYSVLVTNAYGMALSSNATLTVTGLAPVINLQPQGRGLPLGANVTFNVSASGSAPLSYQWLFNGAVINGANSANLVLNNLPLSATGDYSAVITNFFGAVTSQVATLTVTGQPPVIISQPLGRALALGANVTFNISAGGSAPLAYQWLFNGAVINGANSANLVLNNLPLSATGDYSAVITNLFGSATSQVATLTVTGQPPVIIAQPLGRALALGANVTFNISAGGSAPLAYQWLFNGAVINGATGASLILTNLPLSAAGDYSAVVANLFGSATSQVATLTVTGQPPVIVAQPLSRALAQGGNVTFSISASGSAPLAYQWLFDGAILNGATASSLVLTNLPLSAAGGYSAVVTNYFGAMTSQVASLTVTQAVCAPVLNGLVSWWAGEGSALDLVGGNNGSLVNGVGFAPGKVGQSFKFNGTNQYLRIPSQPSLSPTGSFSIEAWVLPQAASGAQMIFGKWGDTGDYANERCYVFVLVPGNILQFGIADAANQGNGSLHVFNSPNNAVTNGVWAHVAAVYNQTNGTRQIFVNGSLVAQRTDPPLTVLNAPNPIGIGAGPYASFSIRDYFKGQIDEVSFYNRALAPAEVGAIFNSDSAGKCLPQFPPAILTQPASQTVPTFTNVNFSVAVSGNAPLAYQWQFGTNLLANATNSVLSLTNVTATDAGVYTVTVTNQYGAVTSSNAVLTVLPPPSLAQVSSVTATSAVVTVPVTLLARGTENGLGFSLNFNPAYLTFAGISSGSAIGGTATVFFNTNAASLGRLGVLLALPGTSTFPVGTQEVADVSFFVKSGTNPVTATISFGDTPTARQVSDSLANILPSAFVAGTVTIPWLGYEGDVAPLPNGDSAVTLIDWVQVGRFVAGLDTITNASEFQRADCAPRDTFGDGQLTVADWVQAGRYAAGLDALTVAGGPTVDVNGPLGFKQPVGLDFGPADSGRILKVMNAAALPSETCRVSVQLTALGNENAVGFSLQSDPAQVRLTGVTLGSGDPGANLIVNTNHTATNGVVAMLLSLPPGTVFSAGTYEVARLNFTLLPTASNSTNILFTNRPTVSQVTDANAIALSTTYQNGVIIVGTLTAPTLRATTSPAGVALTWPLNALGYTVQTSTDMGSGTWTTVSATPVASGADQSVTLPITPGAQRYYRLYHP